MLAGVLYAEETSPNSGWRNAGFRGYADYMETPEFERALARLLETAARRRTAMLCAEHAWQQCHRGLISDQLKAQGMEVVHIQGRTRTQLHPYTEPARLVNGKLSYASDAGQGALPL